MEMCSQESSMDLWQHTEMLWICEAQPARSTSLQSSSKRCSQFHDFSAPLRTSLAEKMSLEGS